MTLVESVLLGIVQALTEFLPVSSSGHLRLARGIFGADVEGGILFDVLLHGGTLVAVFYVYSGRIGQLVRDAWVGVRNGRTGILGSDAAQLSILLIIATLPTGIIGVLSKDLIASDVFSVVIIGGLLLVNGCVLYVSKYLGGDETQAAADSYETTESSEKRQLSYAGIVWWSALLIGVGQGIAILPGISRAGMTIVLALMLGANRERAAEFSFFLSIPAILGAIVLEAPEAVDAAAGGQMGIYLAGALAAAIFGVFALRSLLQLLRRAQMYRFAWYCWFIGLFAISWHFVTNYS